MTALLANGVLIVLSVAAVLPILAVSLECLAALLPRRRASAIDAGDAAVRVAVLIPAHDEEGVIEATLQSVMAAVGPGDRVLVVADNCRDDTAAVARRSGAEVLHRVDPEHRGKGYALNHGLSHLRDDPPDVVVVIDADCLVESGVIRAAARLAHQTRRPCRRWT